MKVIDLLNKIANNDNYKPTFKFRDCIYKYNAVTKYYEPSFMGLYKLYMILNDEVEIIEEDKKIEKLIKLNDVGNPSDLTALSQMQWENNSHIERKINELIDEVNNLKGEIKNGN